MRGGRFADICEFDSAFAYFRQAAALARELGMPKRRYYALLNMANAYDTRACFHSRTEDEVRSDLDSAAAYYAMSLELARALDDTGAEASVLIEMGIFFHQGLFDLTRAETLLTRGIELARISGRSAEQGRALYSRGHLNFDRLELTQALRDFTAATALLAEGDAYFRNWSRRYAKLMDTLMILRRRLTAHEWNRVVSDRRKEIREAARRMRSLKIRDPTARAEE